MAAVNPVLVPVEFPALHLLSAQLRRLSKPAAASITDIRIEADQLGRDGDLEAFQAGHGGSIPLAPPTRRPRSAGQREEGAVQASSSRPERATRATTA